MHSCVEIPPLPIHSKNAPFPKTVVLFAELARAEIIACADGCRCRVVNKHTRAHKLEKRVLQQKKQTSRVVIALLFTSAVCVCVYVCIITSHSTAHRMLTSNKYRNRCPFAHQQQKQKRPKSLCCFRVCHMDMWSLHLLCFSTATSVAQSSEVENPKSAPNGDF